MRKKLKILFVVTIFFLIPFILLYIFRWEFRNDEGKIGKIVNSCFNLNRLEVISKVDGSKIIWSAENQKGEELSNVVYENGTVYPSKIHNMYGVNSFEVYYGNKKETFVFMKSSWSNTYDFKFIITQDSVKFYQDGILHQALTKY